MAELFERLKEIKLYAVISRRFIKLHGLKTTKAESKHRWETFRKREANNTTRKEMKSLDYNLIFIDGTFHKEIDTGFISH